MHIATQNANILRHNSINGASVDPTSEFRMRNKPQ